MNSWKASSASCWLWKHFPCKKRGQDAWRSGSWLAGGQVFMVDEANLHSPICWTFEALVVWHAVRHCRGEELGSFYWPMLTAGTEVFGASHELAECISQMCNGVLRIQKAVVDQMGNRPPNPEHDLFFLVQIWLWQVLWSFFSVQLLSWSSPVFIYNSLFVTSYNPIKKWFIIVVQNKRRWHFKTTFFFYFQPAHEEPTYWAFTPLQFASNAILGNFSCSCRRISFDNGFHWWRATTLFIFQAPVSFAKLLEPPLHCMFISSSWAKCVVDVGGVSTTLQPILNSNKKIAGISFLCNIISITQNKYKINSKW